MSCNMMYKQSIVQDHYEVLINLLTQLMYFGVLGRFFTPFVVLFEEGGGFST